MTVIIDLFRCCHPVCLIYAAVCCGRASAEYSITRHLVNQCHFPDPLVHGAKVFNFSKSEYLPFGLSQFSINKNMRQRKYSPYIICGLWKNCKYCKKISVFRTAFAHRKTLITDIYLSQMYFFLLMLFTVFAAVYFFILIR